MPVSRTVLVWAAACVLSGGCVEADLDLHARAESELRAEGDDPPVRRLTNSEYVAAIDALFQPLELGIAVTALPSAVDVDGFDNHIDLSTAYPSVVESYRLLALDVSTQVWRDLPVVSGCETDDAGCIRGWLTGLAAKVSWRTDGARIIGDAFDAWHAEGSLAEATRMAVELLLLSPEFTYAPRSGNLGDGELIPLGARPLARRLALFLWNAPPDDELLAAADAGELASAADVLDQTLRMLDDPRARTGVLRYYEQLLEWERVAAANLDPDHYLLESPHIANDEIEPRTEEFTGEYLHFRLQPAMRAESELFVEHHLFAGAGTLTALLTETASFGTWDLGLLVYGLDVDQTQAPVRILQGPVAELQYPVYAMDHEPSERAGLLTLAAFLHGHAGPIQPSPVRRGVFVMERLLCTPPPAPPDDVPPLTNAGGGEPLTNRERYAAHTQNAACQSCHEPIDGIGFLFEGYDSLAALRTHDAGVPVDSSGALHGTDVDGPLADAVELAHTLASSRNVHDCHVLNWFRYAFGRSETPDDEALLADLQQSFWDSQGHVPTLIATITSSDEFRHWRAEP